MTSIRIGLVIPVLNNFDQAIDAIYSAKSENDLRVYIQPQYRYQIPLAAAWNRGIRQAYNDGCTVTIVSNDDVLFSPKTIDHLADAVVNMRDNEIMIHPNDILDTLDDPSDILFLNEEWGDEPFSPEDQSFSCFAARSDFFSEVGTFDENFDPAWWEDTDMKYRIKLLGYKCVRTKIPYVHLRHQSTKKLNLPLNSLKSGEYYLKKWGSTTKSLTETFKHPYNDASLSPMEWRKL